MEKKHIINEVLNKIKINEMVLYFLKKNMDAMLDDGEYDILRIDNNIFIKNLNDEDILVIQPSLDDYSISGYSKDKKFKIYYSSDFFRNILSYKNENEDMIEEVKTINLYDMIFNYKLIKNFNIEYEGELKPLMYNSFDMEVFDYTETKLEKESSILKAIYDTIMRDNYVSIRIDDTVKKDAFSYSDCIFDKLEEKKNKQLRKNRIRK